MARSNFLIVDEPKAVAGRSLSVVGPGTPTTRLSYVSSCMLAGYGCLDEKLGDICGNWNGEDFELLKKVPRGAKVFAPEKVLPGRPYGFRGDTKECEGARDLWLPFWKCSFDELHRMSTSCGMVGGQFLHWETPGGHLPQNYEVTRLARRHFPDALHIGFHALASQERALWGNYIRYPDFPDDLALPTVLADNRHRRRIDIALPTLLATLIAAKRIDRSQHSYLELFAHLFSRCKLAGLAEAHVDLPVIQFPILHRLWHLLIGKQPGVAMQEVVQRVADLIVDVLQPAAKLIPSNEPDPGEVQVIGVGGLPLLLQERGRREQKERFQESVQNLVETRLQQMGQKLPAGLKVVWSSTVHRLPNDYVRIPAVRIFSIPDRTARDYVNDMLAA